MKTKRNKKKKPKIKTNLGKWYRRPSTVPMPQVFVSADGVCSLLYDLIEVKK